VEKPSMIVAAMAGSEGVLLERGVAAVTNGPFLGGSAPGCGLRPGLVPATASPTFFPAAAPLLARQEARLLPSSAGAAALQVRGGRPGAPDRHKAAMVAGLEHSKRSYIMSQIGSFTRSNDGVYTGAIKTLAIDAKARLVPSDPASTSDKAPDLRVLVSGVEIGAAWRRTSKEGRAYHSVKLDDPSFTAPIYANLFEGENGEHSLIWSR
jgi:uncharacterized protein (DUF736 family)